MSTPEGAAEQQMVESAVNQAESIFDAADNKQFTPGSLIGWTSDIRQKGLQNNPDIRGILDAFAQGLRPEIDTQVIPELKNYQDQGRVDDLVKGVRGLRLLGERIPELQTTLDTYAAQYPEIDQDEQPLVADASVSIEPVVASVRAQPVIQAAPPSSAARNDQVEPAKKSGGWFGWLRPKGKEKVETPKTRFQQAEEDWNRFDSTPGWEKRLENGDTEVIKEYLSVGSEYIASRFLEQDPRLATKNLAGSRIESMREALAEATLKKLSPAEITQFLEAFSTTDIPADNVLVRTLPDIASKVMQEKKDEIVARAQIREQQARAQAGLEPRPQSAPAEPTGLAERLRAQRASMQAEPPASQPDFTEQEFQAQLAKRAELVDQALPQLAQKYGDKNITEMVNRALRDENMRQEFAQVMGEMYFVMFYSNTDKASPEKMINQYKRLDDRLKPDVLREAIFRLRGREEDINQFGDLILQNTDFEKRREILDQIKAAAASQGWPYIEADIELPEEGERIDSPIEDPNKNHGPIELQQAAESADVPDRYDVAGDQLDESGSEMPLDSSSAEEFPAEMPELITNFSAFIQELKETYETSKINIYSPENRNKRQAVEEARRKIPVLERRLAANIANLDKFDQLNILQQGGHQSFLMETLSHNLFAETKKPKQLEINQKLISQAPEHIQRAYKRWQEEVSKEKAREEPGFFGFEASEAADYFRLLVDLDADIDPTRMNTEGRRLSDRYRIFYNLVSNSAPLPFIQQAFMAYIDSGLDFYKNSINTREKHDIWVKDLVKKAGLDIGKNATWGFTIIVDPNDQGTQAPS